MPIFEVINSGQVTNLIVAETLRDAELATGSTCVENTLASKE